MIMPISAGILVCCSRISSLFCRCSICVNQIIGIRSECMIISEYIHHHITGGRKECGSSLNKFPSPVSRSRPPRRIFSHGEPAIMKERLDKPRDLMQGNVITRKTWHRSWTTRLNPSIGVSVLFQLIRVKCKMAYICKARYAAY